MEPPIRLIIADDHRLFREGLRSLLGRQPDMQVVAEVESANELKPVVSSTPCDVLLLDLTMDRWMAGEIKELSALTKVLVLTASEGIENAAVALKSGARAIVQKRFAAQTLMEAIRAVAAGLVWVSPALQAEIAEQWSAPASKQLTERETEVVCFVASGLRNAEIGARLAIRETTVKTHLNNIFQKLGLRDRVELAIYALRHGLVSDRQGDDSSGTLS